MVTFYDPVENVELSYHIDDKLKKKWDKIREGKILEKDDDRVYIVDGRERTGKSTFAFQQAKYIDPTFNIDRICFTPEEFLEQIRDAPQGSVVVFDEAFRGLSSKASQSKINKGIVQAMMEMGQRNLIVFIVLPTFFLLEIYASVLRSNALFHVYKDLRGKRAFKIYNYQTKSLLYREGKKRGFDYSKPKVRLKGRFFAKKSARYIVDANKYVKKKRESLIELGGMGTETLLVDAKHKENELLLMKMLYKDLKSYKKVSVKLKEAGIQASDVTVMKKLKEFAEKDGKSSENTENSLKANH